jgi:hypothetical protein
LHAAYVSGRATAVSVCQAHLDHIATYDRKGPALGAIIINNPHQWTGRRAKVGKSDREETFAGATGDDKVDEPRAGRPRPRPDLACGGSPRFSRQHPVLGQPRRGTALIERHPDTRFVIDHMAIQQPSAPPAPPEPWADLPKVLELAKHKNEVIKDAPIPVIHMTAAEPRVSDPKAAVRFHRQQCRPAAPTPTIWRQRFRAAATCN